jgi:hypothetical protein
VDESGKWRRLNNEEVHSLYLSPNVVRAIKTRILRWADHVARMEEGRSAFKILTGKPTGSRPLERSRRKWAGHVARMEEGRSAFKILTGKPTGNRPLERSRRKWEDNIRMDLKEIDIYSRNWVDSAEDRHY